MFQLLHVDGKLRIFLSGKARPLELAPHIAGEVFVRRLPAPPPVFTAQVQIKGAGGGVFENDTFQILYDLRDVVRPAHQVSHVLQIYAGFFSYGDCQGLHRRVHAGDGLPVLDRALGEHVRFALQIALIIQYFQGAQKRV